LNACQPQFGANKGMDEVQNKNRDSMACSPDSVRTNESIEWQTQIAFSRLVRLDSVKKIDPIE
jgi:hypothetical protein